MPVLGLQWTICLIERKSGGELEELFPLVGRVTRRQGPSDDVGGLDSPRSPDRRLIRAEDDSQLQSSRRPRNSLIINSSWPAP